MSGIASAIALAGLGVTVGTALHNKKLSKQQLALEKQQMAEQKARQEYLDSQFGRPLMGQSQENMSMVQNYLRQLASGNRSATMQAMAPELNALSQQQQGSVAAAHALNPRGGMGAAQAANLPYQFQGQVNNLMFGARPQAMQQLGQLGQNQASLGLSAMGMGAGLTNSMLQYGLDARRLQLEQGMALGQGIGGMLQFAQQMYGGHNTSTSPSVSPYTAPSQGNFNLNQSNPFSGGTFLGGSATMGGQPTASSQSYNNYLQAPSGYLGLKST